MLSWNLSVFLSKKIKPHITLYILCFAVFQTTARGCRNGHPLWAGNAESWCCRHEAWWEEHLFISFSAILYSNIFIIQWENTSYAANLWKKWGKICVKKVLAHLWLISGLTWILMLTSVGHILYSEPWPYLAMFPLPVITGYCTS